MILKLTAEKRHSRKFSLSMGCHGSEKTKLSQDLTTIEYADPAQVIPMLSHAAQACTDSRTGRRPSSWALARSLTEPDQETEAVSRCPNTRGSPRPSSGSRRLWTRARELISRVSRNDGSLIFSVICPIPKYLRALDSAF